MRMSVLSGGILFELVYKPDTPVATVPKKDVIILLPYLGLPSIQITKRLKSCVSDFYSDFRQPQDHFSEHTPHQILLSVQRPPQSFSTI